MDFYGKKTRSAVCKKCYKAKKAAREKTLRSSPEWKAKTNQRVRQRRKNPEYRAYYVWRDSRKSDLRNGREHSLGKEFVRECLSQPCVYCGETRLKMTLDRMDNKLGHIESNCVPCCVRCNYIRRDMPYEAWVVFVGAVRKAREDGLFGSWTCTTHGRSEGWLNGKALGSKPGMT
jgi:hypothetical protein